MRRHSRLLLMTMLLAVPAAPADWKDKPFPGWTDEDVVHMVTDSPWAKQKSVRLKWVKDDQRRITYKDIPGNDNSPTVKGGSPVGGIGVPRTGLPDRASFLVRWASSLPVRHAKALYKLRDERLEPSKLNELIGVPEADYVLEIYGVPAEIAHLGTGSVELVVTRSAYLRTKSGVKIRPNRVEAQLHATSLTILIHFPRTTPIQLSDDEIECYADLQIFEVKEKFKLSTMMYLNHLEL
ncbi:MAG TPA: hypothetical protein VGK29_19740 [Paludibaculum sp.]